MRNRTPISIFPFLSVLLSTLGVLSFLAVAFLLFSRTEATPEKAPEPVKVGWVGAPAHVRPLLVECRSDGLRVHLTGSGPLRFDRAALERESDVVHQLVNAGYGQLGPAPSRTQLWVFLKTAIQNERRLVGSFTRAMHDLELANLTGEARERQEERYPILLVYPDGVETYELAAYLVETTTRLSVGLEPMLKGWKLPYRKEAS